MNTQSNSFKLSLIIPIYGVENVIQDLLDSLNVLNHDEIEILLIDDGSKDQSGHIAQSWATLVPNACYHRIENGGAAKARNYGLNLARGQYLQFVDADDVVNPDGLMELLELAIENNVDIAKGKYVAFFTDFTLSYQPRKLETFSITKKGWKSVAHGAPEIWTNLFKSSFIKSIGLNFFNFRSFDDKPFHLLATCKAKKILISPEVVYFYRLGREGQSIGVNDQRLYVNLEIYNEVYEWNERNGRNLFRFPIWIEELFTYFWVLTLLRSDLRKEFCRKAARQLLSRGKLLNILLPALIVTSIIKGKRYTLSWLPKLIIWTRP
jgi:glycosyltransferase involved in cell wall biosynthesis